MREYGLIKIKSPVKNGCNDAFECLKPLCKNQRATQDINLITFYYYDRFHFLPNCRYGNYYANGYGIGCKL